MSQSKSKRIALTLPPEIDSLLAEVSALTGTAKTGLITELLRDTVPVMKQVIESIKQAKQGQEKLAIETMAKFLSDASIKLNQAHIDFGGEKAKYDK